MAITLMGFFNKTIVAQNLDFKDGKFILNSAEYSISEIGNVLDLDTKNMKLLEEVQSINRKMNLRRGFLIAGSLGMVAGSVVYSNAEKSDSFISAVFGLFSGVGIFAVSGTVFLISGTKLIITASKRKKSVNNFLDSYNSAVSMKNQTKINFQVSGNGIGLVFVF